MNRLSVFLLVVILIGCRQGPTYTGHDVKGLKVMIDSRISSDKEKAIVQSVENYLGVGSGFHMENLTEITYDSLMFSYLMTLKTKDEINSGRLYLMKAYSELLSKESLAGRPVHILVANSGEYLEYDTTVLKDQVGYASEWGRLRLETATASSYLNSRIAKLLEKSLRQVPFEGPLLATLNADGNVYSVDFVLDPAKHNPLLFKRAIEAIDPDDKSLILDNDELFIHFKDRSGDSLTGSIRFK